MSKPASLVLLLIQLLVSCALVHFSAEQLAPEIQAQEQALHTQQLLSFLPESFQHHSQLQQIPPPPQGWPAPLSPDSTLYQLWQDAQLRALLATLRFQGFRGPIELRVAIGPTGQLLASHVLQQQETPGLGDRIQRQNSAWLAQFADKTVDSNWHLRSDGGPIDHLSGATITSRKVSQALAQTLQLLREHPELFKAQP